MVAGSYKNNHIERGYSSGSYGSLNPDTYKGIKITKFFTFSFFGSKETRIYFQTTNNIPNAFKIKVNDTVHSFTKDGSNWICNEVIFSDGKTYTIEFLN